MSVTQSFDVEAVRALFPGLSREVGGRPAVFFDGPAGSQVPRSVADAMAHTLLHVGANSGGAFATSREVGEILDQAHAAAADLLGTDDPQAVVFGANMTTLTLHFARAYAKTLRPGDELLVTQLEHDANYTPWVQAARDAGARLVEVKLHPQDATLDLDDLDAKLSARTRLLAITAASNAVGSIPPLAEVVRRVHAVGGEVYVDAVHYAPHRSIDVTAWDCDYLACSPYKFFGPHLGLLWGKREAMERLPVYKLRPPKDTLPDRWMTGTPNHEGMAGTTAAIDHIAAIGRAAAGEGSRRDALVAAFDVIRGHEEALCRRLLDGLATRPAVTVHGVTDPSRTDERVPTVAFTHVRHDPQRVAAHLADRGIFVWDGNYYAVAVTTALGLEPEGMVRVGLLHYATAREVDRLLAALDELA